MTAPVAIDALSLHRPRALGRNGARALRRRGGVALVERRMSPPAVTRIVHRPRLTGPLSDPGGPPLVSLVAPAGYGKTTLLCDWAGRDDRPFAWVTLDDEDNDPACLEASVGLAVERVAPQCGTGRFVLVLDDLHAVHARAAQVRIAAIATGLPPHVTLALASRTPPSLPL